MGAKLTKFPVTAPDGTEFRVSFKEGECLVGKVLGIRLHLPRKRFGFREVYRHTLFDTEYDRDNIDYIKLSSWAVADYYEALAEQDARRRARAEAKLRRAGAVQAFEAWDGKITEVSNG